MMTLPKFLLADNSKYPEDIFVLHTEFPRFMINLKDDEIEWFDEWDEEEEEEELVNLVAHLVAEANKFYENELEQYEKEDL